MTNLRYVPNIVKVHLVKRAKNYSKDDSSRFLAETGWENWMDAFVASDPKEGGPVTESENEFIDSVLIEAFDFAH